MCLICTVHSFMTVIVKQFLLILSLNLKFFDWYLLLRFLIFASLYMYFISITLIMNPLNGKQRLTCINTQSTFLLTEATLSGKHFLMLYILKSPTIVSHYSPLQLFFCLFIISLSSLGANPLHSCQAVRRSSCVFDLPATLNNVIITYIYFT